MARLTVPTLAPESAKGTALEVFLVFLKLGCVSFGGPVAHLGYFQKELVAQRKWCDEDTFAEIIALAQSLPGPSSSQVCFALGVLRAGWLAGLAAWLAFTLPSALLMIAFALSSARSSGPLEVRVLHGLQLVAVAIVAQAVMTMQRSLAPDRERMSLAVVALAIVCFGPPRVATLLAILVGACVGVIRFRSTSPPALKPFLLPSLTRGARGCVAGLLAVLLFLAWGRFTHVFALQVLAAFLTSGALVFGGGHVVLPLLANAVVAPGWVPESVFLSGYGAAQALPGPLFTFGAFLGASIPGVAHPILFALIGLFGLSAPGLLAMGAILPVWQTLRRLSSLQSALRGVNAAVVGVLLAALFSPLWTSTVHSSWDFLVALIAFLLLTQWKLPPVVVLGVTLALSVPRILP